MNEVYGRRAANKQPALKRRRGICKRILMVVVVAMLAIVLKPSNPAPKTLTNSTQTGRTVASMPVSTQDTQPVTEKPVESVEVATPPPVETPPEPVVAERPPEPAPGSNRDIALQAGIATNDFEATDYIVSRESSWCYKRMNGDHRPCNEIPQPSLSDVGSKAYGLCQALPATKMASEGEDYMTNPVTQLRWCQKYSFRYGGWWGSLAFWQANKWW